MGQQCITIGYIVEGSTDTRFLGSIIRRTFEDIALDCDREIEIHEPQSIVVEDKSNFNNMILKASEIAENEGISVLCVHCDADAKDDTHIRKFKINPAFQLVRDSQDEICKKLISIVPIRMTESWMLADIPLFKEEIGYHFSHHNLEIEKKPEQHADAKDIIEKAIRIAQSGSSRRKRTLQISELYTPLGQKISIEKLKELTSYESFYNEVKSTLIYW